jgi:hypothetical protein
MPLHRTGPFSGESLPHTCLAQMQARKAMLQAQAVHLQAKVLCLEAASTVH